LTIDSSQHCVTKSNVRHWWVMWTWY